MPSGGDRFRNWFKDAFGGAKIKDGPTSDDLYSGPHAFSGYRPEAAMAKGDVAGMDAARSTLAGWDQMYQQNKDPGAFNAAQIAPFAAVMRQQQQASAGARQAATQAAAARGSATGGAGLQAGLAGVSGDANAAANAGAQLAGNVYAQRQQAAAQALQGQAQAGLAVNDAAFSQDQATRAAQDAFNQWASEQRSTALQTGHANQVAAAQARRNILGRIGQSASNLASSFISRGGNSGGGGS